MTKPKYTFEDWLKDVQYHQPSLRIDPPQFEDRFNSEVLGIETESDPDYIHPSQTQAGQNYLIHNLPESLFEYGFMEESDFQKVVEHREIAYRLALDILLKDVEPYLNTYLKRDNTINQMLIKKRLKEIESYFESVDSRELQIAVSGELLELTLDGPTYIQFIETRDISLVMPRLFNSNRAPGIQSALPGYKRHPSLQVLLRVLLEERNQLLIRSGQLNLSTETILDKYEELRKDASATKATEMLRTWLVDELKLTVEYVQRVYNITIDSEALRQRLHRRRKATTKNS